jgi:glycosyltransferase involved in cell wall biosynthesis
MITYNHEEYISKAIDSVMMQETSFDYELVIGEDCSTDRTREICIAYQNKYPNKIRLILNEKNLGAKPNFIQTFYACKGQYIAFLEGDDYWVSSRKLQKQVDFLETHSDYAICFTRTVCFDEDKKSETYSIPPEEYRKETLTIEDLLRCNFIANCSVLYRNGLFGNFPDWFLSLEIGDWPIHIMNAQHGKVGYLDEVMAIYRIHSRSYSAGKNAVDKLLTTIIVYDIINPYLNFEHASLIREMKAEIYQTLTKMHYDKNDLAGARHYAQKCLISLPIRKYISKRDLIRKSLMIFLKSLKVRTWGRRFFLFLKKKRMENKLWIKKI